MGPTACRIWRCWVTASTPWACVILSLKGIREVAVVGVEDDRWGEVSVAVIHSDEPVDEREVIERCLETLPSY
jgi:acyl-CoA synthetase (AMP-forming)/AMP-acid ligase II